ncbi:MAG: imidazoleglycerol-phosphate dehydratase HisB [Nitrospinota bacterium]|nr:imidazoleglycerol-phosphate dehydratase HisB [Nitrospinota bacterium]
MLNSYQKRKATVSRATKETKFDIYVCIDGEGVSDINTGIGFFDHMLSQVAKHGMLDLEIIGNGDLEVDGHHTVEDVGILLGQALSKSLGDRAGITRFADVRIPMMDSCATICLDSVGRGNLVFKARFPDSLVGEFDTSLVQEFFWSLSNHAKIDLHIEVHYGFNSHHMIECIFKGFARALRSAFSIDELSNGVPSTKGSMF